MKTVLVIAATDSCGGAGLAADVRAVAANGAHAAAVVTAVTAQNTSRFESSYPLPPYVIQSQWRTVASDIPIHAAKSGVIPAPEAAAAIAACLDGAAFPYVLDPVAIATNGGLLVSRGTLDAVAARLFPLAALITPNAHEAGALVGFPVRTRADAARAGRQLLASGCAAVLVKGGHLAEDEAVDVLVTAENVVMFASPRRPGANTHGTGCTLASSIAARLANGVPLRRSIEIARAYVGESIRAGYAIGPGPGPVDQLWALRGHEAGRQSTQQEGDA